MRYVIPCLAAALMVVAACDAGEDEPAGPEPGTPTQEKPGGAPPRQEAQPQGQAQPPPGESQARETLYFPTGEKASSPLQIVKEIPPQIRVNQPVEIRIAVTNNHRQPLNHIVVREQIPEAFKPDAKGDYELRQGMAIWHVGTLAPGETQNLSLKGAAQEPQDLRFCTSVDALPELCMTRKVVVPEVQLSVQAPDQILICEPLEARVVVRNTGSARLEGVKVETPIPEGAKAADGQEAAGQEIGVLDPGASKEVRVQLEPQKAGRLHGKAVLSTAGGLQEEAAFEVEVKEPVLEISREARGEAYIGRPVTETITVKNTSDAPSHQTVVRLEAPGGVVTPDGKNEWSLGTIEAGQSKQIQVTYRADQPTSGESVATAKGHCAKAVEARQEIAFKGIPAVRLEVVDNQDPIPVDQEVTYTIRVTNQGSAPQTNVRITAEPPGAMNVLSAKGPTEREGQDGKVTFKPLPSLEPGERATWTVTARAQQAGDVRFRVHLQSDQLTEPASEEEPTRFFK